MSGAVSGAQMNFVPHLPQTPSSSLVGDEGKAFGQAGREYVGPRSVAPLARGAFSSQDKALAFRHQGEETLSQGSKNIGTWLFRPDV